MASSVFLGLWVSLLMLGFASSAKFDELFQPSWAFDHFNYEGDVLELKLDNYSVIVGLSPNNSCSIKISSCSGRFLVDETPVRAHTNMEDKGVPFPRDQSMGVYSSIWNADDWATQGGRVKTDWSHSPFIASYKGFQIDACECSSATGATANATCCSGSGIGDNGKKFWWDEPVLSELNVHQSHQLLWVRANHMIYDYCTDTARFAVTPVECIHHRH
ncbi:Xyloglucan endotransglucosylase/hydrolase protein 9 [Cucurbita argyrosperma subsp. argyrosperma]|nr:Xyloglucan endotransglucosylase/hydrolase protein 9 [Cucurbita argyrosperma subsp. argyrosperma]